MLPKIYLDIYADAINNPAIERNAFASDWALSSVWGEEADLAKTCEIAGQIYDLSRLNVAELAKCSGMSKRAFAAAHLIPERTMEEWSAGRRTPPDWAKLLLAESSGYFGEIKDK